MPKDLPPKPPADAQPPPPVHLYSHVDPIPVPDAVESETDSVWGLWEDLVAPKKRPPDDGFEATQPAELLPNWVESPDLVDFPDLSAPPSPPPPPKRQP